MCASVCVCKTLYISPLLVSWPLCRGTLKPELVKFVHCVIFILINDGLSLSLNEVKGGNMFSGYWSFVLKERVYAYALCVCMCVCVCVCTCDVSKIV